MYNKLLQNLELATDLSLQQIVNKIRLKNFDKEILNHMDSIEDYVSFFETCSAINNLSTNVTQNISFVLILNRLKQIPNQRTSRYL